MGPDVDLVSYQGPPTTGPATTKLVAFKYWFIYNGMFRTWLKLNSWSRLPRDHPHIVPFDSVVLDPHTDCIVGFTTEYIPSGTLHANNATTRPFRLQWLRQLLSVVDDLNYRYGMMHQDIAPRNLLINERGNLRIFDFNYSIMIEKHYSPAHDDIKGVVFTLYEIITLDEHFREVPFEEQDMEAVLGMESWAKHPDVKLDAEVSEFRAVLAEWVTKRKEKGSFPPAETWVRWPEMPKPPVVSVPTYLYGDDGSKTTTGTERKSVRVVTRKELIDMGTPFWDWERPAGYKLREALEESPAGYKLRERLERKAGVAKEVDGLVKEKEVIVAELERLVTRAERNKKDEDDMKKEKEATRTEVKRLMNKAERIKKDDNDIKKGKEAIKMEIDHLMNKAERIKKDDDDIRKEKEAIKTAAKRLMKEAKRIEKEGERLKRADEGLKEEKERFKIKEEELVTHLNSMKRMRERIVEGERRMKKMQARLEEGTEEIQQEWVDEADRYLKQLEEWLEEDEIYRKNVQKWVKEEEDRGKLTRGGWRQRMQEWLDAGEEEWRIMEE